MDESGLFKSYSQSQQSNISNILEDLDKKETL